MRVFATAVCISAAFVAPHSSAADCSADMVKGRYAVSGQLWDLRNSPATPATIGGAFYADGTGKISEWRDVLTVVDAGEGTSRSAFRNVVEAAKAADSEMLYEIEPDCRFRIRAEVRTPFGVAPVHLEGAVAAGGREILLTQVGSFFVSHVVAKSVDDPVTRIEDRADEVKDLLDRVAVRNGLNP